jgi:hypothetical protein
VAAAIARVIGRDNEPLFGGRTAMLRFDQATTARALVDVYRTVL